MDEETKKEIREEIKIQKTRDEVQSMIDERLNPKKILEDVRKEFGEPTNPPAAKSLGIGNFNPHTKKWE